MATGIDAIRTGAPVTATGGVLFADSSATLPTDATTDPGEAFAKGGFIGEEGVTRATDASDEKIRAWGGDTVKVVRSEHSITYSLEFLESTNADVLKLVHGDEHVNVDEAGQKVSIEHTAKMPPRKAFILDMLDGDTRIREVIPDGQLTTSGEVQFVHSAVIRYAVEIEAFPVDGQVKAFSYMESDSAGNDGDDVDNGDDNGGDSGE